MFINACSKSKPLPQEQKPLQVKPAPFLRSRFKKPKPNLSRAALKRATLEAEHCVPGKKPEAYKMETVVLQQDRDQAAPFSSPHVSDDQGGGCACGDVFVVTMVIKPLHVRVILLCSGILCLLSFHTVYIKYLVSVVRNGHMCLGKHRQYFRLYSTFWLCPHSQVMYQVLMQEKWE